ncbi:MAG: barstar family protein [Ruminiclostridium sp.]|nr:barstar family protein [Ruminiclostridium sp.]
MKKIIINCLEISHKKALHNAFAEKLGFPEWYGGNLDALFDCLTGICEETEIIIEGFAALEENLGSYAAAFKKVMLKADEDNEKITVKIL